MAENEPGPEDAASAYPDHDTARELSAVIAVAVPAIVDPDIASVDVDVSAMAMAPAVGDEVVAIPQEAMEATCRVLNAYVIAANSVRVVFGSLGGNVVGGNKNFKFLVTDLT